MKKKSRLEVDAMNFGLGLDWRGIQQNDKKVLESVSKRYNHNTEFMERNMEAHKQLYDSVNLLSDMGFENIIEREELKKRKLKNKKAVLSLGGDNHLVWVLDQLEYLGYSIPVIGMNSGSSHGGLLYDNKSTIEETFEKCSNGNYFIEEWPKIDGMIFIGKNSKRLFPASQEYILGEYSGTQMSRWVLKDEEQKGNRLIITNGAGSSGWYNSVHLDLFNESDSFARDKKMSPG